MFKLFTLPGGIHSNEAEVLVKKNNIKCEKFSLNDPFDLAYIDTDLGIKKLPALTDNKNKYEGLLQIRNFLENGIVSISL